MAGKKKTTYDDWLRANNSTFNKMADVIATAGDTMRSAVKGVEQRFRISKYNDPGFNPYQDYNTAVQYGRDLQSMYDSYKGQNLFANSLKAGQNPLGAYWQESRLKSAITRHNTYMDGVTDESSFNDRIAYPVRFSGLTSAAGVNAQLKGMQQTISGLRQSGDKKKADALQAEYDWLSQHQYDYWRPEDFDNRIMILDGQLADAQKRRDDAWNQYQGATNNEPVLHVLAHSLGLAGEWADPNLKSGYDATQRRVESISAEIAKLQEGKENSAYMQQTAKWSDKEIKAMQDLAMLTYTSQPNGDPGQPVASDTSGNYYAGEEGKQKIQELRGVFKAKGYSDEEIDALTEYFIRNQSALRTAELMKQVDAWTGEHPIIASIASVPSMLMSGVGYLDIAYQNATAKTDPFTGDRQRINQYSPATVFGDIASTIRAEIGEQINNPIGNLVYQGAMSFVDSFAAMSTGNWVGAGLLGSSAAMQATRGAYERGATDAQALFSGFAAGVAETVFEHYNLEKLIELRRGERAATESLTKSILKQMGFEGSEETFTDAANLMTDSFIMGDKSELNTRIKELQAENPEMTESDATVRALAEWFGQVAEDFTVGALAGGMGAGVNLGIFKARTTAQQIKTGQAMQANAENISAITNGWLFPEGSATKSLADRLVQDIRDGKSPSAKQYGELAQAMEKDRSKGIDALSDVTKTRLVARMNDDGNVEFVVVEGATAEALQKAGLSAADAVSQGLILDDLLAGRVTERQMADLDVESEGVQRVFSDITGAELPTEAKRPALEKVFRSAAQQYAEQKAEDTAALEEEGAALAEARAVFDNAVAENQATAAAEAERIMTEAQATVEAEAPVEAAEPARRAETREEFNARKQQEAQEQNGWTLTDDQLNDMWSNETGAIPFSDGGEVTRDEFFDEMREYYKADQGYTPTNDQLESLYQRARTAAVNGDVQLTREAWEASKSKSGTKESVGATPMGVTAKAEARMTEAAKLEQELSATLLQRALADRGVSKIVFSEDLPEEENGHINTKTGVITIRPDITTQRMIYWTVGHEIFHGAVTTDSDLVDRTIEVFQQLEKEGALGGQLGSSVAEIVRGIDAVVKDKQETYREFFKNKGMSEEEIAKLTTPERMKEEIAADLMGTALASEDILNRIAGVRPSLLTRVKQTIDRLFSSENLGDLLSDAKYKSARKEIDDLADRVNRALSDWSEQTDESSEDEDSNRYSIKTMFEGAGLTVDNSSGRLVVKDREGQTITKVMASDVESSPYGALINYASDVSKTISKEDAMKQKGALASLLNLMMTSQDAQLVWRFSGAAMFSAIKANSDGQYGTTVDFSTVCRKTRQLVTAMSDVMKAQRRGLSRDKVVELQRDILEQGGEVNCPVCYVFSRWAGIGGILENMYRFQNRYGHEYDPTVNADGSLDWSKLDARIAELQAATKTKAALRKLLMEDTAETEYQDLARTIEETEAETKRLRELNKGYRTKAQKRDNAAQIAENKKAIEDNQKKVKEAKAAMQEIEKLGAPELSWLKNVRRHEHYWEAEKDSNGRVIGGGGYVSNPDVLFDLDAGDRFASQYPLAWAYRTGRGPSAGKAIQPYADMRIGDLILGPGRNRTKGEPNKAFANVESNTFNKAQMDLLEAAIARTKAQNLIGGQRFQSTSDFRYDYGLDYLQTFWEAQALGSTMQSYTKVLEFVTLAASVGGDVNISVMPLGKGFDDETGRLQFSDVTGVNYEDAVRLSEQYDSAQLILVGINDEHIRKALDDDGDAGGYYIGFVIPYHASGASISAFIATQLANITQVKNSPDTFNLGYYLDYSPIQTDSEKTKIDANDPRLEAIRRDPMNPRFTGSRPNAAQLRELYQVYRRELRSAILTGKVHGRTGDAETLLQNAQAFLQAGKDNQTDLTGRSFEDLRAIELSALNGNEDALREYESWSDGVLYDIYNKMWVDESATDTYGVRLNSTQSKAIMPHEYWDTRTTRRTAFLNGLIFRSYCHNLGLTPRFTGIKSDGSRARATREVLDADGNPVLDAKGKPVTEKFEYGDFSDERGYWKTLIDRPMYNRGRDGTYRAQNKINATNVAMEMLSPQDGETFTDKIAHNASAAYLARNSTSVDDEGNPELVRYSLRTEPPPMKTQYGFKLMTVDENGRPHAMFIDAARPYELGVWYNADSPELKDLVKLEKNYAYEVDENGNVDESTRIPIRQVKKISEKTGKATWSWEGKPSKSVVQASDQAGKRWMAVVPANDGKGSDGKGTAVYNIGLNGSGTVSVFALRPGIHAVDIPSMAHIGMKSGETMKKNKDGKLTSVIDSRRPDQRWFLIEYPVDQDYNQEAYAHPDKDIKDHLPKDGWYSFQTNSGAEKRQHWFITGAMKIVGPVSEADVRSYARDHGFEEDLPWRQGKAYSDDDAIDLDEYIRTTDAQPTPSKREMSKRIRAEARGEKYSVLENGMPKFSVGLSIADQIKAARQDKMQRGQYVYYGTTTQKMRDIGFRDADDPILMSPSKIRLVTLGKSAADNGAHGITSEQLERIPYYLENPVMMIDSMSMGLNAEAEPTKNNSVIFVTDMLDSDGFPIVAAVNAYGDPSRKTWVDMDVGSAAKYFNEVKTVFGKGPVNSAMPRAITEGPGTTDTGHTFYDYMKQAMDNDAILYISEDGARNLLNASRQWVKEKNQPVTAQAGDVTPRGAERTDSAQSVSPAAAFVKRGDTWSPNGRKVYNNWVNFPKGFASIPRDVILHKSRNIMSPQDRQYMTAVENGDMETVRQIVRETAEQAGWRPTVVYHGTDQFGFTKFDMNKGDGFSIWLTDALETAETYSGSPFVRQLTDKSSLPALPKPLEQMSLQELVDWHNKALPYQPKIRPLTSDEAAWLQDQYAQNMEKPIQAAERILENPGESLDPMFELFKFSDELKQTALDYLSRIAGMRALLEEANPDSYERMAEIVTDASRSLYDREYDGWRKLSLIRDMINAVELVNTPTFAAKLARIVADEQGVYWPGEKVNAHTFNFGSEDALRSQLQFEIENEDTNIGNYQLFVKMENPLVIDAEGEDFQNVGLPDSLAKEIREHNETIREAMPALNDEDAEALKNQLILDKDFNWNVPRSIARAAKKLGYDGVQFIDIVDDGGAAEYGAGLIEPATNYAVFDAAAVKSADPVTYDDEGNVIPLSERFNPENQDIRYSLPGNSPLFDEYMRKLTGQDQAEHLADNPPKQALSQTNSTNHLFNGNERRQKGIRAKDRTHTVVTDEAMDDIVSRRLAADADAEAEKKDLFAPGRKWDATDLAVAEELIRREVEKGRANKNLDEAKRLLRLHDAQMSDWGLAGHTAGRFGSSKMGIVQDAVNTIDESSKNDEANKGKRKTATKVVKDIEGEAKDALGTITDELTGKKPVRRSGDKRRGDRTKDGRPTIPTKEDFDANENGPVRGINQKGEPFTFEYSRVVGEAIAKNIASRQKRDAKSKTFLQQLQAEMMRFANETQSRRAPKSKPTTATALLRSYVENRKFFDDAWNAARDDLRSKFGDKIPAGVQRFLRGWYGVSGDGAINSKIVQAAIVNSAMESKETTDMIRKQHALGVKDIGAVIAKDLIRRTKATGELADMINVSAQFYVDEVLSRPVNDKGTRVAFDAEQQKKMADRMVANALRDIGKQLELTTFGRLGSSSAKVKADLRDAVINTLTDKYGVADADASGVADVVGARFDALLREGMEKRLKSMFKERTPRDKAKQKSFLDRVIELTNLGALDNEAYHDAAVSKLLDGYTTRRGVSADKVLGKVFDYATQLEEIEQGDTKELRKLINKLNAERWTGGMLKGDQINKILDTALKTVEKAPDGAEFLRDLAAAQIRGIAGDNAHITTVEALTSVRYLNMLSKLTTVMRNLAGNTAFDFAETLSNNIGVPIDMLLSLRTGRRTTTLDKSIFSSAKWKGMIDGAMRAYIETALDAPIEDGTNRWEVRNGRTFKMAKPVTGGPIRRSSNMLERFMSTMEKWQRYLLTVSDEFYKGGVRAETQRGIDKLKAAGKLEQDALEDWAMQTALERTFQNEGLLSQGLGKIREGFNYAGIKDYKGNRFGLGTMAAPFLGVPANIAAQIGNYSIPGATRAIVELGNVIRLGNKATAEQQARAVRDAGRALNGMTFMSLLVAAALKGILHVAGLSGDDDEAALERDEGLIGMQLNWSALERAVKGKSTEYRPDDTLVNVGALEPMNGSMTFAAMLAEAIKDSVDDPNNTGYFKLTRKALKEAKKNPSELIEANFHALVQALQDLPALSTITRTYDAYKYSDEKYDPETNPEGNDWKRALDAGAQFIGDVAASVAVPNLLSGIAAGRDEGKVRTTQSQDKRGLAAVPEEVLNAIKAKIPGLRETLPQAVGSWGEGRQTTATKGENWMNSNILPFAVTHYKPDPVTEELKSLRESGEKVTMPKRNAPFNLKTEDGKVKLTDEERREYQTIMGREAHSSMLEAMRDDDYASASESTRANVWANLSSYATAKAKKESGGEASKPDWVGKYGDAAPDEWWADDTPVSSAIAAAWWKTARGAIDKEGTLTNGEKIQAVNSTDMTPEMADTLLTQQLSEAAMTKYRGAVRLGISPELYVQILADTTDEKMPANGVRGGHKAKVKAYLESLVQRRIITQAQMDYLMTLELG